MDYASIYNKRYLILLPAIAAFIIALIPTLKYQWPLGWDIIYHVQYAQVYAHNGFTLTDPLLSAPFGRKIAYPPLFHFIIAGIGTAFGVDFFQVARFLQPILASLIVLSVSYVASKFYGKIAGLGAGFLMLSSLLIGRMVLAIPENLALIFLPLAVYLYYRSLKEKNLKIALLGGVLLIVVLATHQAATLCLVLAIASITLMELVVYRNFKALGNFISFFMGIIAIGIVGLISLQIIAPQLLQTLLQQGISVITGMSTSLPFNRPLGIYSYLGNLGVLVLLFSVIGAVAAVKRHQQKDNVILVWIIAMILLSNAYWFGVNVISYRVLIYLLIPLSILGGYGIHVTCQKLKSYPRFSSKNVRSMILVVILVLSMLSAVFAVSNPDISVFSVKNEFGNVQIAPPSDSEVDLANWFIENGNKSRYIVISNQFTGMFLAARTMMSFHDGFEYFSTNSNVTIEKESVKSSTLTNFKQANVGYIVYDKRLVVKPSQNNLSLRIVNSEFFPLPYFTQDIHSNINNIKPEFSEVVYENPDFIVCEINW